MFISNQPEDKVSEYAKLLQIVGSLSNLFSESDIPYLYYRVAEKIFCRAFNADDLSRGDVAVDARKGQLGIGLKTFRAENHNTFQKVAEFNKDKPSYEHLGPLRLVRKVSQLRNKRIEFAENANNLNDSIYHCVVREEGRFRIYEEKMNLVNIGAINLIKKNKSSIIFEDGIHEYSFLLSKSTLQKRFSTENCICSFDVSLLEDPLERLRELIADLSEVIIEDGHDIAGVEDSSSRTVYLPLYGRKKTVFEKSGLNQWNAGGRERHQDEVYIPVPKWIHDNFPEFFPERDEPFDLKLPSGETMSAKICQDGSKALMSNPNRELGHWLLRTVLEIEPDVLVTYEDLMECGIDSVRVDKVDDHRYEINFAKVDSYEDFKSAIDRR